MKGRGKSAIQMQKNTNTGDEYAKHVAESGGEYVLGTRGKHEALIAKILCVLAAVVLWFYVVITDTAPSEKIFTDIGIDLRGIDEVAEQAGLSVISGHDTTVDLTLSGTKNELSTLRLDDINVWVDISDITSAGEYNLEVKVSLPAGVTLGSISTNSIPVYLDLRTTIALPVKVVPNFTIESSYTLGSPELSIETVNVSGPAEELASLDHARVKLDLGRVSKSTTSTGTLELVDKNGSTVTNPRIRLQNSEVTVYYPVYTYKTLPLAVSYKYGYYNQSNVQISITPAQLELRGEPDVLEGMESILITQLDEKKITGDTSQSVTIMLPDGVESVSGARTAEVKIEHKGTTTSKLQVQYFHVNNPNSLTYTLESNSIEVTFRGTSSLLSYLSPYNVTANIDLGYLNNASGTVEVPVSFTLSGDIAGSVYEIGEYKMQVTITK